MKKKYFDILFVEPCTNFFIRILAKLGIAQRVEYSGVIPDFVDLEGVRKLAKKYRYEVNINTLWDIPEEYIRTICKQKSKMESVLLTLIDIASSFGNLIKFGSFAIVHLQFNKKKYRHSFYKPNKG